MAMDLRACPVGACMLAYMHKCVDACLYVSERVFVHAHLCVCSCVCMHLCVPTCVHVCVYVSMRARVHGPVCMCGCVCICECVRARVSRCLCLRVRCTVFFQCNAKQHGALLPRFLLARMLHGGISAATGIGSSPRTGVF